MKNIEMRSPSPDRKEAYRDPPSSLAIEQTGESWHHSKAGKNPHGKNRITKDVLHQPGNPAYQRRDRGITCSRMHPKGKVKQLVPVIFKIIYDKR